MKIVFLIQFTANLQYVISHHIFLNCSSGKYKLQKNTECSTENISSVQLLLKKKSIVQGNCSFFQVLVYFGRATEHQQ